VSTTAFSKLLRRVASLPASESAPALVPGDRIGRFEIVRELGRGGFGVVHEARDTDLGRHVAIKTLRIPDDHRARFSDEATTAARLNHPNIVTLYDHGVHENTPYLVLELLEGQTLRRRLEEGALPVSQVRDLGIQISRALVHAHGAKVIHRDVKPENVFIRNDGLIKLLDFGVSWARPSDAEDSSGTRGYMAPEQARGEPHDGRADIYALGVVLFEAATGHRPEPGELDHIPAAVAQPIARALAPAPDARPTAEELLAMLGERSVGEGAQPYRWLEAFREDDARWFFGRDREIARLRLLLDTRAVVVLAGPSGAGKSSLVRAGLVPRLLEEQWRVVALRAGERPVDELVAKLGVGAEWREHPGRLGEELRRTSARSLVFVDQAEQLIAWPATDREAFLRALFAAADDVDGPVRVIVAVRDDFLIQLAKSEALRDDVGRNLMLLGPPDAEQLMAALVEPAHRLGFEFEPGLPAEVVGALQIAEEGPASGAAPYRSATRVDTRTETAPLPLLQLAASRLWELRDESTRTIPKSALAKVGGMTGLLAHHADEVLHGLTLAERALARTILTSLITPQRMRRSVERERLIGPRGANRVLDRLIEGRLVTGGEQVELAHESLISGWAQLASWLDDDEARITLRDRIASAALHWDERKRPRELLWRGTPLADALMIVDDLSGRDREFIAAAAARARGRRRFYIWLAAAASVLAVTTTIAAVRSSRLAARTREAAHVQTILHRAELAEDPLVGALALAELGDASPPGGAATALRVGSRPIPLAVLHAGDKPLLSAAISHDGKHVAACDSERCFVWPIDGRGAARTVSLPEPTQPGAKYVTFSADDSALLIGYRLLGASAISGGAMVRMSLVGAPPKTLLRTNEILTRFLVLDDDRIVTGTKRAVLLWQDGRSTVLVSNESANHTKGITDLVRHPDGRILSVGGTTAVLSPLPGDARKQIVLQHEPDVAHAAAILADGRILTLAGDPDQYGGAKLRLWPADGGEPTVLASDALRRLIGGGAPGILPNGRVAYADAVGHVMFASLDGKPPIILDQKHRGEIRKILTTPDGHTITAGEDGRVVVSNFDHYSLELRGHIGPVNDLQLSPDRTTLVSAGNDATLRVWRLGEAPAMKLVPAHVPELVDDAVFSPDGRRVLSVSHDKTARVWDVASTTQLYALPQDEEVHCGEWSPDGKIAIATGDRLRIYDGQHLVHDLAHPRTSQNSFIECGALSNDGRHAAVATGEGVFLFDLATGKRRETGPKPKPAPPPNLYLHVAFSPDSRWLVAATVYDQVYLWPIDDSAPPTMIKANRDPRWDRMTVAPNRAFFMPDGQRIVTADMSGAVRFWSRDGREDTALAFWGAAKARPSRDGRRLGLTTLTDPQIKTVGRGGEQLVLPTYDIVGSPSVDISPDGRRAVTGEMGGAIRFWWITWPDLVARIRASTSACLSIDQRKQLLDESDATAREHFAACERRNGR